jgi:hypothetical protein
MAAFFELQLTGAKIVKALPSYQAYSRANDDY